MKKVHTLGNRITNFENPEEVTHDTRDYNINPCQCGQDDCPSKIKNI